MKKDDNTKLNKYQRITMKFLGLSFLIILILTFTVSMVNTKLSCNDMRNNIIDEAKYTIQSEVDNRYDEIIYDLDSATFNEVRNIKSKIDSLCKMYLNIDTKNMTLKEQQELLIDNIAILNDDSNENNSFFILDKEGNVLLSEAVDSNLTAKEYEATTGTDNFNLVMSTMGLNTGVIVNGEFPKVNNPDIDEETVYVRYLENFGCIIGTGFYRDDIQEKTKNFTLAKLDNYYNYDRYAFIVGSDGIILSHPNKEYIGENLKNIIDVDGYTSNKDVISSFDKDNPTFITYSVYNEDLRIGTKVSYAKYIEDWDSYIVMGYYLGDVDDKIAAYNTVFLKRNLFEVAIIAMLLSVAVLVMGEFARKVVAEESNKEKMENPIFTLLFENFNQGLISVSTTGKVIYSNKQAIDIFGINLKKHFDKFGNIIGEKISDDLYKIIMVNKSVCYLNIVRRSFIINNTDTFVYYLEDKTEEFSAKLTLLRQVSYDSLTGILNRYSLNNDKNSWKEDIDKGNIYSIAIIDLDYLKRVNDVQGHEVGDKLLKLFASTFVNKLGDNEHIYRYGGEEFVYLAKNITTIVAKNKIDNIRNEFKNVSKKMIGIEVTFSAGVIQIDKNNIDLELKELIAICDELLYESKNTGRDRTTIA